MLCSRDLSMEVVNMAQSGVKRLVRSKSGLKIVTHYENMKSPFELSEPLWVPDIESSGCMQCQTKFDFIKRRHHCRRCGRIYCSSCCDAKLPLTRMCFVDPVRLCEGCADVTRKENEFFDVHLKVLTNGANFRVASTSNDSESESLPFFVKLSHDQKELVFDGGDNYKHENIHVVDITFSKLEKSTDDVTGTTSNTSLNLKFKDMNLIEQFISLTAASVPNQKQSMAWITALQKAVKMVFESKSARTPT